ncbi:MAG: GNAT family N-acetyltransferase [Pseudonocardiaceae bacterium]
MGLIIRAAQLDDVKAMGRLTVATFLAAHRGQIPEEVWSTRGDEWSAEDSARDWARTLRAIADDASSHECVYLAVDEPDEVIGIAMGQTAHTEPWPNTGAIRALYVLQAYQGHGLGRRLVGVVARHLRWLGMPALTIAVLTANLPAQRFYEALGGQFVRFGEIEDSGHMLPEIVYGWTDTETLIAAAGLDPDRA